MRREFGITSQPVRPYWTGAAVPSPHPDRTVLLFPQTHGPQRRWPISYWIDLAHLLQQRGLNPALVLQERDPRLEARVPFWIAGLSHPDLFALIAGARLVISSDSGSAHVAGTLGVKTLVLAGPTGRPTYAHLPEVDVMHRESPECSGCHYRGLPTARPARPAVANSTRSPRPGWDLLPGNCSGMAPDPPHPGPRFPIHHQPHRSQGGKRNELVRRTFC